ncbi:MAG: hypothetical protein KDJ29_12750 [Hyphomicrobiales bacterium]|nr:hypothetical protein [Hyphomicrobiales bacterium]
MLDYMPTGRDMELAPPEGVRAGDYGLIEDAVMDTARGRWFLREYARRIRSAETAQLLAALERIEKSVARQQAAAQPVAEPTALPPVQSEGPSGESFVYPHPEELQAIQEKLLDIVWYMRERGFDARLCSAIRQEAGKLAQIAEAGSGDQDGDQDGERAGDSATEQPDSGEPLVQSNDGAAMSRPQTPADRAEISMTVTALETATQQAADRDVPEPENCQPTSTQGAKQDAFAAVDALPAREKLALFA